MKKNIYLILVSMLLLPAKALSCALAENPEAVGHIKAEVVGIEIRDDCTYIMIKNHTAYPVGDSSQIFAIDDAGFVAGRFRYIKLNPSGENYKPMFSLVNIAYATSNKIFAEIRSRYALVEKLSLSKEENSNQ